VTGPSQAEECEFDCISLNGVWVHPKCVLSVCIPRDRRVDVQAGVTPSPGSAVKDQDSFISAEQSGSENMCLVPYATLDRDCCKA